MRGLILGAGEIGGAYYEILGNVHPTWRLDIRPELSDEGSIGFPDAVDILHVCLRYDDNWEAAVQDAFRRFSPRVINVMTTTPPGTTEGLGMAAVHSTTRGLHPNLAKFILRTPKHIGGPAHLAREVADYFEAAGVRCVLAPNARTTELAHIASNTLYGAQIAFARELEDLCRHYGVDYYQAVERYSETHNEGYAAMGYLSKFRPILHPPGKNIGGHCVVPNARLIPAELRGTIMSHLADFNG